MSEVDKSQSQQVNPEPEPDGEWGLVRMTPEQLDKLRHADPWDAAEILRDLLHPKP